MTEDLLFASFWSVEVFKSLFVHNRTESKSMLQTSYVRNVHWHCVMISSPSFSANLPLKEDYISKELLFSIKLWQKSNVITTYIYFCCIRYKSTLTSFDQTIICRCPLLFKQKQNYFKPFDLVSSNKSEALQMQSGSSDFMVSGRLHSPGNCDSLTTGLVISSQVFFETVSQVIIDWIRISEYLFEQFGLDRNQAKLLYIAYITSRRLAAFKLYSLFQWHKTIHTMICRR